MKVVIQKPDLDTCLTALILEVKSDDNIIVVSATAAEPDINDPLVLCIEAGGSGLWHLNNFDHHDPLQYFPPACRQAYEARSLKDEKLNRLVDYVCMVDDLLQGHAPVPFPSLSSIFSGMRFIEKSPMKQFILGMEMLRRVLDENIEPFGTMPDIEEWREFRKAKEDNMAKLSSTFKNVSFFQSQGNKKICFSESEIIGGIGALYKQGCDVVIMLNSRFGNPPVRKFTIAGNGIGVSQLLPFIETFEPGWGGRETIIGSSPEGSSLNADLIIELARKNL